MANRTLELKRAEIQAQTDAQRMRDLGLNVDFA